MKTNRLFRRITAAALSMSMLASLAACSGGEKQEGSGEAAEGKVYRIGICNYVDDASLNQIVENIQTRLDELGEENGVAFEVDMTTAMRIPMCSIRSSRTLLSMMLT